MARNFLTRARTRCFIEMQMQTSQTKLRFIYTRTVHKFQYSFSVDFCSNQWIFCRTAESWSAVIELMKRGGLSENWRNLVLVYLLVYLCPINLRSVKWIFGVAWRCLSLIIIWTYRIKHQTVTGGKNKQMTVNFHHKRQIHIQTCKFAAHTFLQHCARCSMNMILSCN